VLLRAVLLRAGGSVEARIVSFEPLAWPTVLWRAGFGGCACGLSTLQASCGSGAFAAIALLAAISRHPGQQPD